MGVLTAHSVDLAAALALVDAGDLVRLKQQWPRHPPSLWLSMAATSPCGQVLKWIVRNQSDKRLLAGFANEMAARVEAGCTDQAVHRGARRLQEWRTE